MRGNSSNSYRNPFTSPRDNPRGTRKEVLCGGGFAESPDGLSPSSTKGASTLHRPPDEGQFDSANEDEEMDDDEAGDQIVQDRTMEDAGDEEADDDFEPPATPAQPSSAIHAATTTTARPNAFPFTQPSPTNSLNRTEKPVRSISDTRYAARQSTAHDDDAGTFVSRSSASSRTTTTTSSSGSSRSTLSSHTSGSSSSSSSGTSSGTSSGRGRQALDTFGFPTRMETSSTFSSLERGRHVAEAPEHHPVPPLPGVTIPQRSPTESVVDESRFRPPPASHWAPAGSAIPEDRSMSSFAEPSLKTGQHFPGGTHTTASSTTTVVSDISGHSEQQRLPEYRMHGAPKSILYALYGKDPYRKVLGPGDYITWNDDGPPHNLRFTSVFVCPVTGEIFPSGRHGPQDKPIYADREGFYWYTSKKLSEHGAAACAYDCLSFRSAPPGKPYYYIGDDEPYGKDKRVILSETPDIPKRSSKLIKEAQKRAPEFDSDEELEHELFK